jgi:hypothetical protein
MTGKIEVVMTNGARIRSTEGRGKRRFFARPEDFIGGQAEFDHIRPDDPVTFTAPAPPGTRARDIRLALDGVALMGSASALREAWA